MPEPQVDAKAAEEKAKIAAADQEQRLRLAAAEGARQALEGENRRLQEMIANRPQAVAAPVPAAPDPFDKLSAEDITLAPEEKKRLLNDGINRRVDHKLRTLAEAMEKRNLDAIADTKNEILLRNFYDAHKDLDEEGFAAAMAKAKFRAEKQGYQLTPAELIRLGGQLYDEARNPAPGPSLEGGSPPQAGPGGAATAGQKPRTWFEKKYGASPKDELIDEEPDFEKMGEEYLDKKHTYLADAGVTSMLQKVLTQDEERRKPERKSLIPQV